jgi:hypothetical protein
LHERERVKLVVLTDQALRTFETLARRIRSHESDSAD